MRPERSSSAAVCPHHGPSGRRGRTGIGTESSLTPGREVQEESPVQHPLPDAHTGTRDQVALKTLESLNERFYLIEHPVCGQQRRSGLEVDLHRRLDMRHQQLSAKAANQRGVGGERPECVWVKDTGTGRIKCLSSESRSGHTVWRPSQSECGLLSLSISVDFTQQQLQQS